MGIVASLVKLFSGGATVPKRVARNPDAISDARSRLGLDARRINWGFTGRTGQGKSSLINALRGMRARNAAAAPVGVTECTKAVTRYPYGALLPMADLVDMPGAGTKLFPVSTYFDKMRLDVYDAVILVTSTRFSSFDRQVVDMFRQRRVPFFLVRTKIDNDVQNAREDSGLGESFTGDSLVGLATARRHKVRPRSVRRHVTAGLPYGSKVFLVSTRPQDWSRYDLPALKRAMAQATVSSRVAAR